MSISPIDFQPVVQRINREIGERVRDAITARQDTEEDSLLVVTAAITATVSTQLGLLWTAMLAMQGMEDPAAVALTMLEGIYAKAAEGRAEEPTS
jgi:hypothetical protein